MAEFPHVSVILALESVDVLPLFEVFLVLAVMRGFFPKQGHVCIMLETLDLKVSCSSSLLLAALVTARSRWKSRLPSERPRTSGRRGCSLCCRVGMRALVTCALCPLPLPCLAWHAVRARTAQSWLAAPALVSETPPCWCWGTLITASKGWLSGFPPILCWRG